MERGIRGSLGWFGFGGLIFVGFFFNYRGGIWLGFVGNFVFCCFWVGDVRFGWLGSSFVG